MAFLANLAHYLRRLADRIDPPRSFETSVETSTLARAFELAPLNFKSVPSEITNWRHP